VVTYPICLKCKTSLLKGGFLMSKNKEELELMRKRGLELLEKWMEEELKREDEKNEENEHKEI
jgi:hypothetical protein